MPRKPTLLARNAHAGLLAMLESLPQGTCLPTLGVLGEKFQLHASTIFRLLRDMAAEGVVWQSPAGKFFPLSAQRNTLRGAPLCFIGRETWQWSLLYQEILEGVSEVCSANASPLILLSSRSLVRQEAAVVAPQFASSRSQAADLACLASAVPRGGAGFLFDHLWSEKALGKTKWPGGERIQLLHGTGRHAGVLSPDYSACAKMAADFASERRLKKITLVIPFVGDPAIDIALSELRRAFTTFSLAEFHYTEIARDDHSFRKLTSRSDLLLCPEDNVACDLANRLSLLPINQRPVLLGTQGTGVLHAPNIRLRIDYRRLGRAAASRILHGMACSPLRPSLVDASSGGELKR